MNTYEIVVQKWFVPFLHNKGIEIVLIIIYILKHHQHKPDFLSQISVDHVVVWKGR